jgi:hypothetical protein
MLWTVSICDYKVRMCDYFEYTMYGERHILNLHAYYGSQDTLQIAIL